MRNNLEIYTSINNFLIYFSWGTVRIQSQKHQKAIWKLVTAIWWWAMFSGTHTAFKYLLIRLQLPYLQTKIRTRRKYRKYFLWVSAFVYVHATCMHAQARACAHTHTHKLNDTAYYTNAMYIFYLAVTICYIWHKARTLWQYQNTSCWPINVSLTMTCTEWNMVDVY